MITRILIVASLVFCFGCGPPEIPSTFSVEDYAWRDSSSVVQKTFGAKLLENTYGDELKSLVGEAPLDGKLYGIAFHFYKDQLAEVDIVAKAIDMPSDTGWYLKIIKANRPSADKWMNKDEGRKVASSLSAKYGLKEMQMLNYQGGSDGSEDYFDTEDSKLKVQAFKYVIHINYQASEPAFSKAYTDAWPAFDASGIQPQENIPASGNSPAETDF